MNRRSFIKSFVLLLTVGVIVVALAAYTLFFTSAVTKDAVIKIPTGSNFATLQDTLRSSSAIANIEIFEAIARLRKLDKSIKPGSYILNKGEGYLKIVHRLRAGEQTPITLTFNNIRSLEQLASTISKQLEVDSAALMESFFSQEIKQWSGLDKANLIGMFIPNSYQIYWNISAQRLTDRLVKEYELFWNDSRKAKLKKIGLTRSQAITLASIVYEESKKVDEMPLIAGVYMNRLRIGMPLQADPTVKFAVGDHSLRRILIKHTKIDSPYNTYKYRGLPPGPICMPSIQAIESVLNYQKHNYLYFCAKADFSGYHTFATNLSQHNRNAAAYARELNRLKIK